MEQSGVTARTTGSAPRGEEVLRLMVEATSPTTGEEFFHALVRNLARILGVKFAFITECMDHPPTRLRMLAFWAGDGFRDPREYELKATPCETVINEARECCYPARVSELFPREQALGVESYRGMPIIGSRDRRVIGHIAFLDPRRMPEDDIGWALARLFAVRAGAELERLHAEERARFHLEQLARLSRATALGAMGAALAHELNQPLSSLANYARACHRLLGEGRGDSAEVRVALERIAVNAERAGAIVRNMREFLAKRAPDRRSLAVNGAVREAVRLAAPGARERRARLRLLLEEDLPPVLADPVQLQQVVLNLVANGLDAMGDTEPAGREITIATARRDAATVEITVRDRGPGLSEEARQRLFEPFFTTKQSGLGMGLCICKSIAEAGGGSLEALEGEGPGAAFRLALPVLHG